MRSRWRIPLGVALVIASACRAGSSGPSGPSGPEPEVLNRTDDFYFRWSGLLDFTTSRQYSWTITGPTASITQSSSGLTSADPVTLIIRNASGTEVYRGDLRVIGTFQSATTAGGTYTVRVEMRAASGTIDFRVLKSS